MKNFLTNELSTVRNVYRNQLEQGMSMLQKWGDAYIAMLLSGTVIAIIIMISVVIYAPTDLQSSFDMSYAVILAISVFGIVLMYTSVPDDPKSHGLTGPYVKGAGNYPCHGENCCPAHGCHRRHSCGPRGIGRPDLYFYRYPDSPARHHRFY